MKRNIKYYLSFIGWGRSGNSLVGALLNYHPNIYIKNEFSPFVRLRLNKFPDFKNEDEIFNLIMEKLRKKRWTYQYWGGFTHPQFKGMKKGEVQVIGGKKGGFTSNILNNNPELFNRLYDNIITTPSKFIHVQRNPYDNITTYITKKKEHGNPMSPERLIHIYFEQAESVKKVLAERDTITVRLEDLIKNTEKEVQRLCDHLDIKTYPKYLNHCRKIVWNKPRQTRFKVNFWTNEMKKRVSENMKKYEFMDGYTWK
jgi:hypothetical protein